MADKKFLDIWIVDSNTVYREVPFNVVTDWITQGRLLETDRFRRSGTGEWLSIGDAPEFIPYLPRPEPMRAEDQAEALEPVQLDFHADKKHDEADDEVDMIPLIDVSLVLLIFFMLTASGVGAFIQTPAAEYGEVAAPTNAIWVGIALQEGRPVYSIGDEGKSPSDQNKNLPTLNDFAARFEAFVNDDQHKGRQFEVSINATPDVEAGLVRSLTVALETDPLRKYVIRKYVGVSERQP